MACTISKIDPIRLISKTVSHINDIDSAIDFAMPYLESDKVRKFDGACDWIESLKETRNKITKFIRTLKENSNVQHSTKTANENQPENIKEPAPGSDPTNEGEPNGAADNPTILD